MKFISEGLIRFVKFGMVGVLNTLINWIIFFILDKLGVYYILANIISYSISTVHSYLWNALWVFKYKEKDKAFSNTTIKFILLNIMGLCINTGIFYILVDFFGLN